MLAKHHLPGKDFKSFVLQQGEKIYIRSSGALHVLKILGGAWSLFYAFIVVPPFLRDGIYEMISRNRYKWFGEKTECWIPTPELKERFLD